MFREAVYIVRATKMTLVRNTGTEINPTVYVLVNLVVTALSIVYYSRTSYVTGCSPSYYTV